MILKIPARPCGGLWIVFGRLWVSRVRASRVRAAAFGPSRVRLPKRTLCRAQVAGRRGRVDIEALRGNVWVTGARRL